MDNKEENSGWELSSNFGDFELSFRTHNLLYDILLFYVLDAISLH